MKPDRAGFIGMVLVASEKTSSSVTDQSKGCRRHWEDYDQVGDGIRVAPSWLFEDQFQAPTE